MLQKILERQEEKLDWSCTERGRVDVGGDGRTHGGKERKRKEEKWNVRRPYGVFITRAEKEGSGYRKVERLDAMDARKAEI